MDMYDFEVMEFHVLTISQDRDKQSCWSGYGNRDIDEISPYDLISIDDRVDNWVLLEC